MRILHLNIVSCTILYAPYTWLINISMIGVYSGIQWSIYVKLFNITPAPPHSQG